MTDSKLSELSDLACSPKTSLPELRRVALVAIGELSMLREDHAQLIESLICGLREGGPK